MSTSFVYWASRRGDNDDDDDDDDDSDDDDDNACLAGLYSWWCGGMY